MPIEFPEPPLHFRQIFNENLAEMSLAYRTPKESHPFGTPFDASQTEMPHQVLSMSLRDLKSGGGLDHASADSWRVFLTEVPPVRVAEIADGTKADGPLFLGLSSGPGINFLRSELRQFSRDESLESETFRVQVLRVPSLYLTCLWLAADDHQNDIFVALPEAFPPFSNGTRYSGAEFIDILHGAASKREPNLHRLLSVKI